jgi:hypothetical protein
LAESGFAQSFVNLNFENAHFTVDSSGTFFGGIFGSSAVYASNAIPGWTPYLGGVPQTDIVSNGATAGSAMVSLQGTNTTVFFAEPALQGRWSIFLQGFSGNTNALTGGTPIVASIGQTGQIPLTANSVLFWGYFPYQNNFTLTFNGQDLSLITISNALNYTAYGADVSAFAGQTGQLLFSAGANTYAELDNISFSTLPVPEPSAFALATLGALFLGFRRPNR